MFDDLTVHSINLLCDKNLDSEYQGIKQSVADYVESILINDNQTNRNLLVMQQLVLVLNVLSDIVTFVSELNKSI